MSALENLGFKPGVAASAVAHAQAELGADAELNALVRVALKKAAQYAKERVVFGRPIGQNQGIQHPLAESWMELEAANLMVFKAAWMYDNKMDCGPEANAAKYLAAEAGFNACQRAVICRPVSVILSHERSRAMTSSVASAATGPIRSVQKVEEMKVVCAACMMSRLPMTPVMA